MVYVNSKKFACESCIKGHRSSSCHHTDRPLFEIKKKGRPVSQCTKCRELRQSKKFHSKCTCNHRLEEAPALQPLASSSNSKTRRFIPIVPALPNGLRDVLTASQAPMQPSDSRQRVDSLLNPCDCKSLWKCKCRDNTSAASCGLERPQTSEAADGLVTLASAAAAISCCTPSSPVEPAEPTRQSSEDTSLFNHSPPRPRSRAGNLSNHTSNKRHKRNFSPMDHAPGPDLAPLLYLSSQSSSAVPTPMPEFASMPPMSEISSLAGSGCTCGVKCACPGCMEHQAPTSTNPERRDCGHGCGACIDASIGMALPDLSNASQGSTSFLDRFFARAAALPPPPHHRKMSSYHLDPMDTTLYSPVGGQSSVFGSINLPKLECCGGLCNCPSGQCTCRTSCAGCCADKTQSRQTGEEMGPDESSISRSVSTRLPSSSCCA